MGSRLSLVLLSFAVVACGGETHEAPIALALPPSASVEIVDAAPPPAAPPPTIEVTLHDPAVRTAVDAPDPVNIDPKLLALPSALRAHLARQSADDTRIDALHDKARNLRAALEACDDSPCRDAAKMRKASKAADDALSAAVASYEQRASRAIAELTAASEASNATASVALATALYVRFDHELHAGVDDDSPRCERGLERDFVLHPCGDVDPRVARAFVRAADLAASTDPLALVARRGVAQTASAKGARAALEPLLSATTGAPRVVLLADLAIAYAAGPEPDYESAARAARELVPLLDALEKAAALRAPKRPSTAMLTTIFGMTVPAPGPPTLYARPSTAVGASRLALFALSRTGRDREIVDAAIDLAGWSGSGVDGVARLVADAVERSDDSELAKAPSFLQRDVFEQLAVRSLYRGDLDAASKWAHRADALGESSRARAVLSAIAKYPALPPPDGATDPDDLPAATTAHADATRRFASYLRLCIEPFGGTLGEHARFVLTISKADASGARSISSTGDLPTRAADCLRERSAVAFVGIADGSTFDVAFLPPVSNDPFGTGGLGLSGVARGGGGDGIGLGNRGARGRAGSVDAGAAGAAP